MLSWEGRYEKSETMKNMKKQIVTIATLVLATAVLAHPATANSNQNLLVNGSFEEHVVIGNWNLFSDVPGWNLIDGPGIEIQRGVGGWDAFDGEQWIELDSDQNGPGGGFIAGETGSSTITQTVQTVIGQTYMLNLGFSPRPGIDDNHLIIRWNDDVIYEAEASGIGLDNTSWEEISILVHADSNESVLEFADHSVNDTLGTLIDGISLMSVPAPGAISMLAIPLVFGRTRRRKR